MAPRWGWVFKLQDDILGIFGKQQETGKPVGNDLREGKKTLLTQFAFDHAKPANGNTYNNRLTGRLILSG